jgi:hypothetical protein
MRRSFLTRPPTHLVRITVLDDLPDEEKAALIKKLRRTLRRSRAGGDYLAVHEWSRGRHHHNLLVRARGRLTKADVDRMWARACPGVRASTYCLPVTDPVRVARYVVKDVSPRGRHGHKRELPPVGCKVKRLVSYSTGFFAAPPKELWAAQVAEWREKKSGGQ